MVVAPVLPRFTREYRDIVVEVLIENRFTNILERRFDAGIRLGESLEKDVVAVPVSGPLRLAVVGAPDYFARHPAPLHPRDLRDHSCINLRFASAGTLYKCEFEKGGRSMEVAVDGPLVFDDSELAVDAALSGVGLACVLDDQATSLVEAGALVRVLEHWCEPFPGFFLY